MRCLPLVREGILRLFVRVRELECDAGVADQCPLKAAPSFKEVLRCRVRELESDGSLLEVNDRARMRCGRGRSMLI